MADPYFLLSYDVNAEADDEVKAQLRKHGYTDCIVVKYKDGSTANKTMPDTTLRIQVKDRDAAVAAFHAAIAAARLVLAERDEIVIVRKVFITQMAGVAYVESDEDCNED